MIQYFFYNTFLRNIAGPLQQMYRVAANVLYRVAANESEGEPESTAKAVGRATHLVTNPPKWVALCGFTRVWRGNRI